ncbi:hypothetical protein [Vibrio sp. T11.5]|uniref:hypothetical protein n=1 Tax=Vibrio sp. T11.5 TaxID=2998836 RepID=UPI0022CD69C8|nr:hypothetical protein [Vibrio sp. T11.5]MDA0117357.1 hypothetical protein [Vibrio sp. T11.5]
MTEFFLDAVQDSMTQFASTLSLADSVWHVQGGLVYPDYVSAMFTAPSAELIRSGLLLICYHNFDTSELPFLSQHRLLSSLIKSRC